MPKINSSKNEETIEVYKKLGKEYLRDIQKLTLPEFCDFTKLIPRGGSVLDVGCAGGRDSKKFVEEGFGVVGIDLVDEFLSEARVQVPEAKFIKMDIRDLTFPSESFDAVWANSILLHFKKREVAKILAEFNKILKSHGSIFIGVKEGAGEVVAKDQFSTEHGRFFSYFTEEELRNLLKNSGFNIEWLKRNCSDIANRKSLRWIRIAAIK